nr:CPB-2B [Caenorhabditis japonica]AAT72452.1 CPB-2B [Caenorhabditis japonica]
MEEDDEEMEEKYFFKQSHLVRQRLEQMKEREKVDEEKEGVERREENGFSGKPWKFRVDSDEHEMKSDDVVTEDRSIMGTKTFNSDFDDKSAIKSSLSMSLESNDVFYANYRNFFRGRPEVHFLIRCLFEKNPETFDNQFIDLYEKTRKRLEMYPNPHINQILRRTLSSSNATETRVRSKHAVVVSNFREPDRRLGRYSKYYYHHNVGPEVYSRKVFVGGLPACVTEDDILGFFSRYGRLQVDWPSKHYGGSKSDSDPSLCSEIITPPAPLSHLSMASPPFGQINPFMSGYVAPAETRGGFLRASGFSEGGGFGGGFGGGIGGGGGFNSGSGSGNGTKSDGSTSEKRQSHLGYVFLLFEKERSVRDLVAECFEEEEGLFITLESSLEPIRVQIRPWLLADAEFLMDFNVPINTKLVAFIGGVPRPLKAVELAHFFEQTYGNVVCVGIDIDNKFKYPRGSGRVAFSNYDAYVQAITDRYIVLDHEDIHKRVEIKPYFFHNQSCEECSGRYHRQHAPFFCPSLECFQYYCEPCWHKMHAHPSRFHHMPVVKGV